MNAALQSTVAPLEAERLESLKRTTADFDREQLIWSSGFLAGLAQNMAAAPAPAEPASGATGVDTAGAEWTIFYATETGNSRRIAEQLQGRAKSAGIAAKLADLTSFKPRQLARVQHALFVIATHGIGEPPEGTEAFFDYWLSADATQLDDLEYSVLALGDSSYADFCEIGRRLDKRLSQLGANRVAERIDCDIDFDADAARWSDNVLAHASASTDRASTPRAVLHAVPSGASRANPFQSPVLSRQKITGRGSSKDVRHIELDLAGSGLEYAPGDSLGVRTQNAGQIVSSVLAAADLDGNAEVRIDDRAMPLADALREKREITALSRPVLTALASEHPALAELLTDRDRFDNYLKTNQVVDALHDYPVAWQPQTFVDALRKLPPRLYSIASSPLANPDEAHLTVGVVDYERYGRPHWGSASNFLISDDDSIPVFVEPNEQFRLPEDPDTPIIMIGAGTGVAPYRAFMEHRRELGHGGRNWLIFGDRNFSSDFLYQIEWLRFRKEGLLEHIDVAFSRDAQEKVYVQHRIREQAHRFYSWLNDGAHVYVCGDASRMAVDVHAAISDVLVLEGKLSAERAAETMAELKAAHRYQRDVY